MEDSMRTVYGVGINDSKEPVTKRVNGKKTYNPYYARWRGMLCRCYNAASKKRLPAYEECYVVDEWLVFSVFKEWMKGQDWEGQFLDKDLLKDGNKEYGPRYCSFVPSRINLVLGLGEKANPTGLTGVTALPFGYVARCSDLKTKHKGTYKTAEEAHMAWRIDKALIITRLASDKKERIPERVRIALLKKADHLLTDTSWADGLVDTQLLEQK